MTILKVSYHKFNKDVASDEKHLCRFPPLLERGVGGVKTPVVCALPDKRHPSRSSPGEVDDGEDAQCVSLNPLKASWGGWGGLALCVPEKWIVF